MNEHIQVFRPNLGEAELKAISRVFIKAWPGRGEEVTKFEQEFARKVGVSESNVLTTNSCTEAFFQILEHLKFKSGNVVMPAVSFVGIANAVLAQGLDIKFCDVDPSTGNPTLEDIKRLCDSQTRLVVIQHFGGIPADIQAISHWASEAGVLLVEDAAGALGSWSGDGSCGTFGDFGIWSLDSMKMVVAGDGGVIYCRNTEDASAIREKSYMGLSAMSGAQQASKGRDRWWEFDVTYPGRRSIMNDIQAAVARVQLEKLDSNIETRRRNAQRYLSAFSELPIEIMVSGSMEASNHYFFPILVEGRDSLARHLRGLNVYTTLRYYPLDNIGIYGPQAMLPGTRQFESRALLLPQHSVLKDEELERVVEGVFSYF